ncbi:hypothetical protein [Sagittula marina]|uniref:hypothetical protein n=1 Tax=Sagittula marina TaxID=943940 RepID=UPI003CD0844C
MVVVADGQTVCEHARITERSHRKPGKVIYDWRHCLALVHCPRTNGGQGLAPTHTGRTSECCAAHGDAGCLQAASGSHGSRKEGGDRAPLVTFSSKRHCRPVDGRHSVSGLSAQRRGRFLRSGAGT